MLTERELTAKSEPITVLPSEPKIDLKTQVVTSKWYRDLSQFEKADPKKAIAQLANTFVPYVGLWIAMILMIRAHISFLYVLPLMVVAAGLVVRIFIFQHDCGHGSFLPSHRLNRYLGFFCGMFTFTPFDDWKHEHAAHHATAQDLDRRGFGDIPTLTVEEYKNSPFKKRLFYRAFRNPFVLFVAGPAIQFIFVHRFAHKTAARRERMSVYFTNIAILACIALASATIGLKTYLLIQVPIIVMAASAGVWLFYIQHQYEDTYWAKHQDWDPIRAALEGSSYYRLPKLLQWFSGNIGLHHIHHLRPRIPNYNLQKCYNLIPELQNCKTLTLSESLKSMNLHLWDESKKELISFGALYRGADVV